MMASRHDVIVVGAGMAGAIIAAELVRDNACQVLVLEAGPVPDVASSPWRIDARVVPGADPGLPESWQHPTRLTAARDYTLLTGRGFGGSSSINGGYFIRPRRDDVIAWQSAGGAAWAPSPVMRTLMELESDLDFGATDIHGAGGPIPVSRTAATSSVAQVLYGAAAGLGFVADPDKNAWEAEGVGPVPCAMRDGIRWDSGTGVLRPMMHRQNLTVTGDARVQRVLVEGGRAVGVTYVRGGTLECARADRVILCAGAIGSAHLLLLSGIGPVRMLADAGVPVLADAPGVASGFSSHPQIVVEWIPRMSAAAAPGSWLAGALHAPGVEVLATNRPLRRLGLPPGPEDMTEPLALMAQAVTPRRDGRMRLRSADPDVPLELDHRYLTSAASRRDLREAVRLCARLLASHEWLGEAVDLDKSVLTDERRLDEWIATRLGTTVHVTGTVPFGGEDAPLDGVGHVKAVPGLTVADASMLPTAPRRGPAASVALAAMIVSRDQQQLTERAVGR